MLFRAPGGGAARTICYQPPMTEPSRSQSRHLLALAAAAALVMLIAGFFLGRATTSAPEVPPAPTRITVPAPKVEPSPVPQVQPVLGRPALLAAATRAADLFAGGGNPVELRQLVGQRFEIALPFGCTGPSDPAAAPMSWRYDEEAEALRVRVVPVQWPLADWIAQEQQDQMEALEGFWIDRPWTSSGDCPSIAAEASQPPDRTLALAQLFTASGSRAARRKDDAFSAVVSMKREELDLSRGLRLRLLGRIAASPDGNPALCRTSSAAERPVCLLLVSLDEVAVINPMGDVVIARWDVARVSPSNGRLS